LEETEFDVLVVGGGATGLGAALEAARRGLKTALVERGDFASGTSSKSTNMLHGGVRYLQAFLKDRTNQTAQMELVKKVGPFFKED
jgi:glycerol-3-phosphate dehydrogenase